MSPPENMNSGAICRYLRRNQNLSSFVDDIRRTELGKKNPSRKQGRYSTFSMLTEGENIIGTLLSMEALISSNIL